MDEFGIGMIVLGIFLTFFGNKYNSATLFIAGFSGGSLLGLVSKNESILKITHTFYG